MRKPRFTLPNSMYQDDLFQKKHLDEMGVAVWLFAWLHAHQSQIPLTDREINKNLGWPLHKIKRYRQRLEKAGYIKTKRVGNDGLVYEMVRP